MPDIIQRSDLTFMLRDWLRIEELFSMDRFASHSMDMIEAMLDVAEKIGQDLLAPSLRPGDAQEPWLDDDGQVRVNAQVAEAVRATAESGLFSAVFEEELGGMQLPFLVYVAAMGILHSAGGAAASYMMLTVANARVIANAADRRLFDMFGAPQIAATTFGTMCLSEPHAGSALGDITTRATFMGADQIGDRYRLTGAKMWISGADQDITENIIHLVLAKATGENGAVPEGTRGISLFVVPKILPSGERNDVVVVGLNHKLGARAMPNCALNFGEGFTTPEGEAGAVGWRVGAEGQGLPLMFQMMNEARISVGLASAMTAYRGYLISLAYARERRQGRLIGVRGGQQVPIIEHSDVRRMLLAQKAIAEGALALTFYAARVQDEETALAGTEAGENAALLLGLLTPIVKSWPAEFCQTSLHYAIQTLGGAGYTRDFELELLYRDNRLNPIHEGTTGIQGIDLVNRKLRKDGGAAYRILRARIEETLAAGASIPDLAAEVGAVRSAWSAVDVAVDLLTGLASDAAAADHATAFLNAMGHAVISWLWLDQAVLASRLACEASREATRNHLFGKIKTCRYFAQVELPFVEAWLAPLRLASDAVSSMKVEEFLGESL